MADIIGLFVLQNILSNKQLCQFSTIRQPVRVRLIRAIPYHHKDNYSTMTSSNNPKEPLSDSTEERKAGSHWTSSRRPNNTGSGCCTGNSLMCRRLRRFCYPAYHSSRLKTDHDRRNGYTLIIASQISLLQYSL